MAKVMRVSPNPTRPGAAKKSLWRRVVEKLMFWRGIDEQSVRRHVRETLVEGLSGLWQPSEVLEKERTSRRTYFAKLMDADLVPSVDPKQEARRMRRMRKEAKQLQKAAKRMTRLAVQGKIPLEQILPLAFPELGHWRFACPPKTQGLKPFKHIEPEETAVSAVMEGLDKAPILSEFWTHRLQRLSEAAIAATLMFESGGDRDDALTMLNCSCGPLVEETLAFAELLGQVPRRAWRMELEQFLVLAHANPLWREWEGSIITLTRDDILANGLKGAIAKALDSRE